MHPRCVGHFALRSASLVCEKHQVTTDVRTVVGVALNRLVQTLEGCLIPLALKMSVVIWVGVLDNKR